MKYFGVRFALVFTMVTTAQLPAVARAQAEGLDLLDQVIAQRRTIKSGALQLVAKGSGGDGDIHHAISLWFSGPDVRFDRIDHKPLLSVNSRGEAAIFRTAITSDTFIHYTDLAAGDGRSVVSLRGTTAEVPHTLPDFFDPRILGVFAIRTDALHSADLDSLRRARENHPEVSSREVELDGRAVTQVQLNFPTGRHTYWVDSRNQSVVKAEIRISGRDVIDTMACENQLNGGVWFPRVMRHERRVGERVTYSLRTEVAGELNISVDDSSFTLAGMDIPKGTRVATYPSGPTETWDGEQLVKSLPSKPPAEPGAWNSGWVWSAVGLITLGVLLLVRGALKREPKA